MTPKATFFAIKPSAYPVSGQPLYNLYIIYGDWDGLGSPTPTSRWTSGLTCLLLRFPAPRGSGRSERDRPRPSRWASLRRERRALQEAQAEAAALRRASAQVRRACVGGGRVAHVLKIQLKKRACCWRACDKPLVQSIFTRLVDRG